MGALVPRGSRDRRRGQLARIRLQRSAASHQLVLPCIQALHLLGWANRSLQGTALCGLEQLVRIPRDPVLRPRLPCNHRMVGARSPPAGPGCCARLPQAILLDHQSTANVLSMRPEPAMHVVSPRRVCAGAACSESPSARACSARSASRCSTASASTGLGRMRCHSAEAEYRVLCVTRQQGRKFAR